MPAQPPLPTAAMPTAPPALEMQVQIPLPDFTRLNTEHIGNMPLAMAVGGAAPAPLSNVWIWTHAKQENLLRMSLQMQEQQAVRQQQENALYNARAAAETAARNMAQENLQQLLQGQQRLVHGQQDMIEAIKELTTHTKQAESTNPSEGPQEDYRVYRPHLVTHLPQDTFKALSEKYSGSDYQNVLDHLHTEDVRSQERVMHQTAMYNALVSVYEQGIENEGWYPIMELLKLIKAPTVCPSAELKDIFNVANHEVAKSYHRNGEHVYNLFNMSWEDGMKFNVTFIKLSQLPRPQRGGYGGGYGGGYAGPEKRGWDQ